MKSLIIIFIIYVSIYFYGQSLPNPFVSDQIENNTLVFKNNSLPLFRKDGRKLAHFKCQELITDYQAFQTNKINIHLYAFTENLEKKNVVTSAYQKFKSPPEDIFLDADKSEFKNTFEIIYFKNNVRMTFGKSTYLETEECQWIQKEETIYFPLSLTLQSGNNLIKGEKATFDTRVKNVIIEKNIVSFFELADYKTIKVATKDQEKLTKLTSIGPLLYNNNFQSVKLPHATSIKNTDFTLSADQIEFYLNDENKIYLLKAEGNVKIKLIQKNVNAWCPKATIDFEDKKYHFMEKDNLTPFIEMNGYRQTASYITYNEITEILKAGPEVKSVKILPDAKE